MILRAAAFLCIAAIGRPSARAQELAESARDEWHERLERVIDLPDPGERARAGSALAQSAPGELPELIERLHRFGRFERSATGASLITAPIWDGETVQELEQQVYVPANYDPAIAHPLLVVLHEMGGHASGTHRAWVETAEQLGLLVLAPSDAGNHEGYGFSARERTTALSSLRWMRRRYNVDENRIFLTGVSRGGHMCWDVALRNPDRFAAIAPMIGGPRLAANQGQNNFRYLEQLCPLSIAILQGAKDDPGLVLNQHLAVETLKGFDAAKLQYHEFPELGHNFRYEAVDWVQFFGEARRDPFPRSLVVRYAAPRPGRQHWIEILTTSEEVSDDFTLKTTASRWNAMDEEQKRRLVMKQGDEHTARVAAQLDRDGTVVLKSSGVRSLRLWLPLEALPAKSTLSIKFDGRRMREEAIASKQVLLEDFVERFDRCFLPVAAVEISR